MPMSALSTALLAPAIAREAPPSDRCGGGSAEKRRGVALFDAQGCGRFLRTRHPHKTAAGVEAAAGVPARTVERWLTFEATPSVPAFARLVGAYGPSFLAAAVPGLAWVERAAALCEHEAMAAEIEALQRSQARLAAELLRERT